MHLFVFAYQLLPHDTVLNLIEHLNLGIGTICSAAIGFKRDFESRQAS